MNYQARKKLSEHISLEKLFYTISLQLHDVLEKPNYGEGRSVAAGVGRGRDECIEHRGLLGHRN